MEDPCLLLLSDRDNVLITCRCIDAGETIVIGGRPHVLAKTIELGHKLARCSIGAGEKVVKYGVPIGSATQAIEPGEHVHIHNLKSDYIRTHLISEAAS